MNPVVPRTTLSPLTGVRLLRVAERIMRRDNFVKLQRRVQSTIDTGRRRPQATQHQLQLLLRDGATFNQLRPLLAKLYAADSSTQLQAQIVELAVLHGDCADVAGTLKFFAGSDFYLQVNPMVRARLLVTQPTKIQELLLPHKNADNLLDSERFFVWKLLCRLQLHSEVLVYFEQYRQQILKASAEHQLSADELFLTLGKVALRIGYTDGCRQYLQEINRQSASYRTALRILLIPPDSAADNQVLHQLTAEGNWENRLLLLNNYLLVAERNANPLLDRDRPALNAVLADLLPLIPRQAEAWGQLAKIIVNHRQLRDSYPNLYRLFDDNRTVFHGVALDKALWQVFLTSTDPREQSFQGLAHLHNYLSTGSTNEKSLWKAKLLLEADGHWSKTHRQVCQSVEQAKFIPSRQRQLMTTQLRVAAPARQITIEEINDYLAICTSRYVLMVLEKLVADRQDDNLERQIIWRKANFACWQNRDLGRFWQLTAQRLPDLAWRTASVLNARQALPATIRKAWQISGEKRSSYPLSPVTTTTINSCVIGFSDDEQKFLNSFIEIAMLIPALFARLDRRVKVFKRRRRNRQQSAQQIDQHLDDIPWLNNARKIYYFSYDGLLARNQQMPLFIKKIPDTVWGLLLTRIVERLSLNLWSWQLSLLVKMIDKAIPKFITRSRLTVRAYGWLNSLSPEQRHAWNTFMSIARRISDNRAETLFGALVCRLATCIYQNHYQALLSLQLMGAPLPFVWELEKFILADQYSDLRQQLATAHRVVVAPAVAQSLTRETI